jgi:ParB family chromosome partitioning protein
MATAIQKSTQKVVLSSSRDIPFNKFVLSQSNVRRIKAGVSIEDLAQSIARRGLIQSLHVRPVLDAEGQETGMFEVPAGGRRYRALELLMKQKRLNKSQAVPCVVGDAHSEILPEEISFAENDERVPPHPLDQFRAFQAMRDKGMTEEAIAAAFMIDVTVVKQRLRLAAVSPALLEIFADDGMELKQLMAFTVSQDHARQEQVWEQIRTGWQKDAWHIKRLLTESTVSASDKRAVFVGVDAYEAAGGTVLRDLFASDEDGWLQDVGLLDRLVAEKLKAAADQIGAEGWKWVEAAVSLPYGVSYGMRQLSGTALDMTAEEKATRAALQSEFERLQTEYEDADELPDEIDARLGELEAALEEFANRAVTYDPADMAMAGVFVTIDVQGTLVVDRGYVRPEDEPSEGDTVAAAEQEEVDPVTGEIRSPTTQRATVSIGGQAVEAEEEDDDGNRPLPERLVIELTAHRTLALRDAVATHPHIAMTALLHKLVSDTFLNRLGTGALEASVRQVHFPAQADDLKDSASAKSVIARQEYWGRQIPADDQDLWDWLAELDSERRMELMAHCVSHGVNALHERPNPYGGTGVSANGLKLRLAQADRLAQSTGLDMVAAGWRPTVGNYFGRVTKARIVAAVREGAGERAAQLIDHMKKGDMAKEAERLLANSGWLPEPLRQAEATGEAAANSADQEGPEAALPAFLSEESEDEEPVEDEHRDLIAAE